jgi:3-phosphoshikimate 1-carboxyvinyltransferase
VKESDRIAAMVEGLRAMGASIEAAADGFTVEGPTPLEGARLDAHGDHRIAMALAIAACLARGPSELAGEEWVAISFPAFFARLAEMTRGLPAGASRP